jgi:hypothetical protein
LVGKLDQELIHSSNTLHSIFRYSCRTSEGMYLKTRTLQSPSSRSCPGQLVPA